MSRCSAPVWGHKTDKSREKCPVHRLSTKAPGGLAAPPSPRASSSGSVDDFPEHAFLDPGMVASIDYSRTCLLYTSDAADE